MKAIMFSMGQTPWLFEPHDPALAAAWLATYREARDRPESFAARLDEPRTRSELLAVLSTSPRGQAGTRDARLCAWLRTGGADVEAAVSALLQALRTQWPDDVALMLSIARVEAKLFGAPHGGNAAESAAIAAAYDNFDELVADVRQSPLAAVAESLTPAESAEMAAARRASAVRENLQAVGCAPWD